MTINLDTPYQDQEQRWCCPRCGAARFGSRAQVIGHFSHCRAGKPYSRDASKRRKPSPSPARVRAEWAALARPDAQGFLDALAVGIANQDAGLAALRLVLAGDAAKRGVLRR